MQKRTRQTAFSKYVYVICIPMLLLSLCLTSCSQPPEKKVVLSIHGKTMGTVYTIKWVDIADGTEEVQKLAVQAAIEKRLNNLNQSMSTYIADSEIMRFNETKPEVRFKASKDLFNTLLVAQGVSKETQGAFDVTVAPLINLWGFGETGRVEKRPTQMMLNLARASIGYKKLNLITKKQLIEKKAPVTINLSAVAKGYAVDALATTIEHHNIYDYMVEIGGEVFARGSKPNQKPWVLGIEKPVADQVALQRAIKLDDYALATSGDYRNYFEEAGVRFSHTIDPTTGAPINHKLASVSVLDKTCAKADAYATAFMVMGDKRGVQFAQDNNIIALFLIKSDSGFVEVTTGGFERFFVENEQD